MPNIELKPCPFCRGKACIVSVNTLHGKRYKVICKNADICPAHEVRTKPYNEKRQAVEAWNRRSSDD